MNRQLNTLLRQLPAVNTIINSDKGKELVKFYGHHLTVEASSLVLELWRKKMINSPDTALPLTELIIQEIRELLAGITSTRLKRVVNATGIILHTNLGRAVLSQKARKALDEAAAYYTNLEYNLEKGERGSRYDHVEDLLVRLTGAEGALVVNNNAGAVLLIMNTLAAGREVIVSRGELVEIGGSFRIPEVLKLGGVKLAEVGTTNRTHYDDYKNAVSENTALILKVHTSNYRITGYTQAVPGKELLKIARSSEIPLVEDLGSGTLLDLSGYGLVDETPVKTVIETGVDVVAFSGDKLLGGPQAGIIVGKKKYIKAMKANQLTRALRVDKFTLAALEATLREYLRPDTVCENIPVYRMLCTPLEKLQEKASGIIERLGIRRESVSITGVPTVAQMGGGSIPGEGISSWGIAISHTDKNAFELETRFRKLPAAIIGYIEKERFILDMRTLLPGDEEILADGIRKIVCEEV